MRPSSSICCSAQKASLYRSKPDFSAMTHAGESGHFKPPQTPSCDLPSDNASVFGREYTAHLNPCHFVGIAPSLSHAQANGRLHRPCPSCKRTQSNRLLPKSKHTDNSRPWSSPVSVCQNHASPLQNKRPPVNACRGIRTPAAPTQSAQKDQA